MRHRKKRLTQADLQTLGVRPGLVATRYPASVTRTTRTDSKKPGRGVRHEYPRAVPGPPLRRPGRATSRAGSVHPGAEHTRYGVGLYLLVLLERDAGWEGPPRRVGAMTVSIQCSRTGPQTCEIEARVAGTGEPRQHPGLGVPPPPPSRVCEGLHIHPAVQRTARTQPLATPRRCGDCGGLERLCRMLDMNFREFLYYDVG